MSPYALKLKKVGATTQNINHKAFFAASKVEVKNEADVNTTAGSTNPAK